VGGKKLYILVFANEILLDICFDTNMFWITVLLTPETPKTYRWLTNVTKLTNQINQRRRWDAGGWAGISCIFSSIFRLVFDLVFEIALYGNSLCVVYSYDYFLVDLDFLFW